MENDNNKSAGSVKTVEVWVSAIVLLFGALVVYDSYRLGAGWGKSGPQTGYFPFYIGLLICISSLVNLVRALRNRSGGSKSFVSREQLKLIMVMLVPTIIYVGLIRYLGLYLTSTLYIAYFMWWLGKYSWVKIVPVSVGVSLAFFLIFELWFRLPLPKGPLETALGMN
jgi:hypothetical protein